MQINILWSNDLKSNDIESSAIIFTAPKTEFINLISFGEECVTIKDENGELLVSPWASNSYRVKPISEGEFWERSIISDYLKNNTDIKLKSIKDILCYWDEWNNKFHVLELTNNMYYGVSWCTTA